MFKNKFRFSNQSYIILIFDMKDDSYRWNTLKLFFIFRDLTDLKFESENQCR